MNPDGFAYQEAEHLTVLHRLMKVVVWDATGQWKEHRGFDRQREQRELECKVRRRAVLVAAELKHEGYTYQQAAGWFAISVSSLSKWQHRWRADGLAPRPRGRPVQSLTRELERRIVQAAHAWGLFTGVARLVEAFPEVPRAQLEHILKRCRRESLGKRSVKIQVLRWKRPGTVWAMDFADPPNPVDGIFKKIFIVRDLGSGKNLLWLPMPRANGVAARDALLWLFEQYGAPLVVKEDNDSRFGVDEIERLFFDWGVTFLRSPVRMPWYNGSCEAGIGTQKTYTHHEAARHDRPGRWTCDDVEAGRLRANSMARPRGPKGPCPNEIWATRAPIAPQEREKFLYMVGHRYDRLRERERQAKGEPLNDRELAVLQRRSVRQTLVNFNLLFFRWRRIRPRFKSRLWSRIT
jgi:hypothetical protein